MAGKIIMWIVCFGCGVLFVGIGVFAWRRKEPMWFYSGTEVDPASITDVPAYNRANAVMWMTYSLWYFAAGIAACWSALAATAFLVAACSIGIILLVATYNKVEKKFGIRNA